MKEGQQWVCAGGGAGAEAEKGAGAGATNINKDRTRTRIITEVIRRMARTITKNKKTKKSDKEQD